LICVGPSLKDLPKIMNLKDIGKFVHFDEPSHTYTDIATGKKLISVTTTIGKYKAIFDEFGHIARAVAKKEGVSTKEILQRWEDKKNRACVHGTAVHACVEDWINTKEIKDNEYRPIVEQFAKIPFKGELMAETLLFSRKHSIAGTVDFIELNGNKARVSDLKSNEVYLKKPKYGNKFTYPLEKLPECHSTIYSLQILLYGELLKEWGFDFEPGWIIHINRETGKLDLHEVLDLRKEVAILLDHYSSMEGWW
jgi:ATP-dependent exoDNAse (exonuclease V) beta subunit